MAVSQSNTTVSAADPFAVHLQFRIALWRAQRARTRIEAALAHVGMDEVALALHLGEILVVTVSLPCGTIGEALRGTPAAIAGLRGAWYLANRLVDLEPVFANGTPGHGELVHAAVLTLGDTRVLREIFIGGADTFVGGGFVDGQ